jgi:hypothetical protein
MGKRFKMAKFKTELVLLLTSIVLFAISAFCFSYGAGGASYALSLSYPLRAYALLIVGFGGAFMTVASISFSKRSKNCL